MRREIADLLIGLTGKIGRNAVVVVCLSEESRARRRGMVHGAGLHLQGRCGIEANIDEVNGVCLVLFSKHEYLGSIASSGKGRKNVVKSAWNGSRK